MMRISGVLVSVVRVVSRIVATILFLIDVHVRSKKLEQAPPDDRNASRKTPLPPKDNSAPPAFDEGVQEALPALSFEADNSSQAATGLPGYVEGPSVRQSEPVVDTIEQVEQDPTSHAADRSTAEPLAVSEQQPELATLESEATEAPHSTLFIQQAETQEPPWEDPREVGSRSETEGEEVDSSSVESHHIQEVQRAHDADDQANHEESQHPAQAILSNQLERQTETKPVGERVEPGKRGGRPRVSHRRDSNHELGLHRSKPEIVCLQRSRQWILAVEVPEDFCPHSDLVVLQNGSPASPMSVELWRLGEACGVVSICLEDGQILREFDLGSAGHSLLLFKLGGADHRRGRLVQHASAGAYLLLVPQNWRLEGDSAVSYEPAFLPGYRGCFFVLDEINRNSIAFQSPDRQAVIIRSNKPRLKLVGQRLIDATQSMGPLFGSTLPRLCGLDVNIWNEVKTIVVGEEGTKKKKRWRLAFNPSPGFVEQQLPHEVLERGAGWYYLRFYDQNDDLMETLDFRFVAALKAIDITASDPIPSSDGHQPMRIRLVSESDLRIEPLDSAGQGISIQREANETFLCIPADPVYDVTRWKIGSKLGHTTELTIFVDRIWWAVGAAERAPTQWEDEIIFTSPDSFSSNSDQALWLRFPHSRWADSIHIGFEQASARAYPVLAADQMLQIPLRDFADSVEVANSHQDHLLQIWVERRGNPFSGPVLLVSASPPDWIGIGKKRSAVALALLRHGTGRIRVNGSPPDVYFRGAPPKAQRFLQRLVKMDQVARVLSEVDVSLKVIGSTPDTSQQPKAAAHALARALTECNPELKPMLKQEGFGGARIRQSGCLQEEWLNESP